MSYYLLDTMGYAQVILHSIFDKNYLREFFVNIGNPAYMNKEPTFSHLIGYIFRSHCYFDELMAFGPRIFQIIIPIFAVIPAIDFYKYYHSIFHFSLLRKKQGNRLILIEITKNSLKLGISIFIGYVLFMILAYSMSDMNYNSQDIARTFLLDIFGDKIIIDHKVIYYLIEGSIRFFMIPFVYSFFAQSSVLHFNNLKEVMGAPILYYYFFTFIGYALSIFNNDIYVYLSPAVIMSNGTFRNMNSYLLILMNILPMFFGLILIYRRLRQDDL